MTTMIPKIGVTRIAVAAIVRWTNLRLEILTPLDDELYSEASMTVREFVLCVSLLKSNTNNQINTHALC